MHLPILSETASQNVLLVEHFVISIFLVPGSQYNWLEEVNKLTALQTKNISKRPERTLSTGVRTSTSANDQNYNPIAIGRPMCNDFYHPPVSLFQAEFSQFKEDIVSGPID